MEKAQNTKLYRLLKNKYEIDTKILDENYFLFNNEDDSEKIRQIIIELEDLFDGVTDTRIMMQQIIDGLLDHIKFFPDSTVHEIMSRIYIHF